MADQKDSALTDAGALDDTDIIAVTQTMGSTPTGPFKLVLSLLRRFMSLLLQNSQSAAYTLVLSDGGKMVYHPSTDANARTFTIPANSSVAYPIGTAITFINETSQVVSIAITTDTLVLVGTGATGTRSLAQYGIATAVKVTSTRWYISGVGLT